MPPNDSEQVMISVSDLRRIIREAVQEHDQRVAEKRHDDVQEIVQVTVREMFTQFGIDHENPFELQQDFARLREWRQSFETIKRRSLWLVISTALVGLVGLIVLGFRVWLGRTP